MTDAVKDVAPSAETPAAHAGDAVPAVHADSGGPPAGDAAPSVTDTVDSVTTAATTVVHDTPVAHVLDGVSTGPLPDEVTTATGDSGLAALGSLTHSIGGVTDAAGLGSVTGGITEAGSAVVAVVDPSVVPQIGGTALQIASPLTTSVDSLDASFSDTVAAVTAPFAVSVPAVEPLRSPAVAGEAASPSPAGDSSTDGSVTSGTHTLVDGAAVSAAPATTAPGAEPLIAPEPAFGAVMPGATDPLLLRLDAAAPTALDPAAHGALSAPAIDQPASAFDAPGLFPGAAAPDPTVLPDPAMADPLSPADSALAAIADVAPDARILVSAAVLAMAAAAMVGPRTSGSGADMSMVFTNVRLLPCVVKESLARHVEMLTALAGADGGSGAAAAVSHATGPASASGPQGVAAKWSPSPAERVEAALDAAAGAFRDGFEQAIAEGRQDVGEGLRDSRLMMQLGMLLGFVYVGFLSVWFWATRLRGMDEPDAT